MTTALVIACVVLLLGFLGCDFEAARALARRPITTRDVRENQRWRVAALVILVVLAILSVVALFESITWSRA